MTELTHRLRSSSGRTIPVAMRGAVWRTSSSPKVWLYQCNPRPAAKGSPDRTDTGTSHKA